MKIALVYPDDFSIWHFHKELLIASAKKGCNVYAISPPGKYVELLENLGVFHIPINLDRFLSPISDLKLLFQLYKIFRSKRFDIVHNFTIKPNIYGSVAAKMAGIKKIIGTAEGLGFMYANEPGLKIKIARHLVNILYRIGCKLSHKFWFVNPDDLALFIGNGIIPRQKAFFTVSAGVSLKEYFPNIVDELKVAELRNVLNLTRSAKIVTMIVARVIWSKGVKEFIEAAKLLRRRLPSVKFLLIGGIEENSPQSVPEQYLREEEKSENFQWLGFRKNIKEFYALSDLVVLPSYYREGVPNVLLEAMAMEKPIITTDNVGCREVVENGKNGYLVPVKDSKALATAIEDLINDDNKRKKFGKYSRVKSEKEFNKELIVKRVIKELYQLDL